MAAAAAPSPVNAPLHFEIEGVIPRNRAGEPLYPYTAGVFGSGANMAFRADALRAMGGFDTSLGAGSAALGGDDLAAFFDVIEAGHTLVYEPTAFVRHRHRADRTVLVPTTGEPTGPWNRRPPERPRANRHTRLRLSRQGGIRTPTITETIMTRFATLDAGMIARAESGYEIPFAVSWGAADFGASHSLDEAIKLADERMYESRRAT